MVFLEINATNFVLGSKHKEEHVLCSAPAHKLFTLLLHAYKFPQDIRVLHYIQQPGQCKLMYVLTLLRDKKNVSVILYQPFVQGKM